MDEAFKRLKIYLSEAFFSNFMDSFLFVKIKLNKRHIVFCCCMKHVCCQVVEDNMKVEIMLIDDNFHGDHRH